MNSLEPLRQLLRAKLPAYILFYRGAACRSLLVAAVLGGFTALGSKDYFSQALYLSTQFYPTLGLAADAGFRLLLRREEFLFYHNATCSTAELYTVSFIASLLCAAPFLYLSSLL